ncbi:ATP-binding protein [Paracoccus aestuarii]|uniref:ATP-binding protein n=1 Tax=Paracoccus aestuarii TaxID=453842 RepID=A0A418ZUK8_9RHOB|nr:AAA family ATPase [Paracoccus aestuarii]RJL03427.1 ATP-binding protein [Paracoccus aestuarii]WCR00214.1 ATP-binding protein [Paracoccus aestuarii]
MRIYVHHRNDDIDETADVLLEKDSWDDYGFETKFRVWIRTGKEFDRIGSIKIGHVGQKEKPDASAKTVFPKGILGELPDGYFSIGQSENFYDSLQEVGTDFAKELLDFLHDLAAQEFIPQQILDEDVYKYSLMRNLSDSDVIQFKRLARGDTRKIAYSFSYTCNIGKDGPSLSFEVMPTSPIPTNLHAIIGSNGVGKTTLFKDLVQVIGFNERGGPSVIDFTSEDVATSDQSSFKKIVFVSFSVFDQEQIAKQILGAARLKAEFIGLLKIVDVDQEADRDEDILFEANDAPTPETEQLVLMSRDALFETLLESAKNCMQGGNKKRWFSSLDALGIDPLFEDLHLRGLENSENFEIDLRVIFDRCSSGHAISLLAVTRLVELVEERTLVLFDEPESHLHPPLLSALLSVVNSVVTERNAIAIVATHSPVVLQEVPKMCVWLLTRSGDEMEAFRPTLETLGENVGVLTREIFELQMRKTGFNRIIHRLVNDGLDAKAVIAQFNGSLGSEGRSLVHSLIKNRDR